MEIRALFTSSGRISVRREGSDGADCDKGIALAIAAEQNVSDDPLAADRKLTEELNKAPMRVLVAGGAGYVGSKLVPALLEKGYEVTVLDLYLYGNDVLKPHLRLKEIKGDMRNLNKVAEALEDCDHVIHLACISNDPSFELNPQLGKSINFDAFEPFVRLAKEKKIRRFIYASSSSVYGVKEEPNVTEEMVL